MKNNIDPFQLCHFSHGGMMTERECVCRAAKAGLTDKPLVLRYLNLWLPRTCVVKSHPFCSLYLVRLCPLTSNLLFESKVSYFNSALVTSRLWLLLSRGDDPEVLPGWSDNTYRLIHLSWSASPSSGLNAPRFLRFIE